jgi:LacI family transcriptional regulator
MVDARSRARVTLADVAAEAGVSPMTVSNVVNERPGVSEATRKRVLEVASAMGYVPNLSARGLARGRTNLVGVVTHDLTSQYALEIVRGIADELAAAELEALISATYQNSARERERVAFLTQDIVDGLILIAPVLEPETLEVLQSRNRPTVVIDPRRIDIDLPRVTADNYHGTRAATEHLIELGHRRIAYIAGDPDFDSSSNRLRGYYDALRLAGIEVDDRLIVQGDFSRASGAHLAEALLAKEQPTAIVAAADVMALGAIDAARAAGVGVPADVSVVGFDDIPQAEESFPKLTTVRQPLHEMGQTGARMLLSLIEGKRPLLENVEFATTLVVRATTAAPPPQAP